MRPDQPHVCLLLISLLLPSVFRSAAAAPAHVGPLGGAGRGESPALLEQEPLPQPPAPLGVSSPGAQLAYPLYRWPLGRLLDDGLVIVNYVDLQAGAGLLDYQGGAHTYDGHAGIDYTLHNFRFMDRGTPVLAASSGTVAYMGGVAPGAFDRSCGFSWPDDGNWLWIANGDGTYAEYYHLRRWSLTVGVGETVIAGDTLGLVGSSGYSTAPHLHFGTGDYFGGPYQSRDPYNGPSNPLPSLWLAQEPYVGNRPLQFKDLGVYTDAAVGGSVFNTTYCQLQEGIQAPTVFGIHEPHLNQWFQFQGNPGDAFRIEVVRPNGSLWAWYESTLGQDARFDWFWVYWFWDGNVSAADYGTWTLKAYANGTLSRQRTFQAGPTTDYGPRLLPAGRSFRINGATQRDTLRTTALSPAVTFSLLNAPSFVALAGNVVSVGATSNQSLRSRYFQVRAVDGSGRADTAWYHVVDMSKPLRSVSGVGEATVEAGALRLWGAPAAAGGGVRITFVAPVAGEVQLTLFDVMGRAVRRLAPGPRAAGRHEVVWDGRDDRGRWLASGRYFARLVLGGRVATAPLLLVHQE